jgi:hypothetical protein
MEIESSVLIVISEATNPFWIKCNIGLLRNFSIKGHHISLEHNYVSFYKFSLSLSHFQTEYAKHKDTINNCHTRMYPEIPGLRR